jgi:hypothetical protein
MARVDRSEPRHGAAGITGQAHPTTATRIIAAGITAHPPLPVRNAHAAARVADAVPRGPPAGARLPRPVAAELTLAAQMTALSGLTATWPLVTVTAGRGGPESVVGLQIDRSR